MSSFVSFADRVQQELVIPFRQLKELRTKVRTIERPRIADLTRNADQTIRTKLQNWLFEQLTCYGNPGLLDALAWHEGEMAQRYKSASGEISKQWQIAQDKERSRPVTLLLLYSAHWEVIKSCIAGDVPYRKAHDQGFRNVLAQHHALVSLPGIYVNYIARRETPGGYQNSAQLTAAKINTGNSLTRRQLQHVLNKIKNYMNHNTAGSADYAKKIDSIHPASISGLRNIDWHGGERRFFVSDDVLQTWVEKVEEIYLSDMVKLTEQEKDQPMKRCFAEVGFGLNCKSRALQHQSLSGSNVLFSLVVSVVDVEFPQEYEIIVFQLFRLWEDNQGQVAEMLGSLLTGSYWFDGGLNPNLSGNLTLTEVAHADRLQENRIAVAAHPIFDQHLELDSTKLSNAKVARQAKMENTKEREEKLQQREAELEVKINDIEARAKVADCATALQQLEVLRQIVNERILAAGGVEIPPRPKQ